MSRLSDLLNPAPSQTSSPRPIDVSAAESNHGRNQSITSPLEALAIAATDSPSVASPKPFFPPHSQQETDTKSIAQSPKVDSSQATSIEQVNQAYLVDSVTRMNESKDNAQDQPTGAFAVPAPTTSSNLANDTKMSTTAALLPSHAEVKKEPSDSNPPTPGLQSPTVLPTTEGKKRPAPKPPKKGTASVIKRPAVKKRKVESQSKDGTPFSQRSGTPNSSRASKTPAPKNRKHNSATPAQSPGPRSVDDEEEEADDDDGELFCICRRPDDHKWMIGCDGGCDDWFHGRCVDMREEDAELIDKYICPNCTANGIGITTWKPMCRLDGCREPARVTGPKPSKYCCDEHGEEFMNRKALGRSLGGLKTATKKTKVDEGQNSSGTPTNLTFKDLFQAHLRGGYLSIGEVKSLVSNSKTVEDFKRLGETVLAPDNVSQDDVKKSNGDEELLCTPEEKPRLVVINRKKEELYHRQEALKDKEKLLGMVKSRAKEVLEELNKRPPEGKKKDTLKDICGFDFRLSWSDFEFDEWRQSPDGLKALEAGILGPQQLQESNVDGDGDTKMTNSNASDQEIGRGVCQKKRCDRHKQWTKLHSQEIASEKAECHLQLKRLSTEAKGIEERAMIKKLEAEAEAEAEKA